ncbi:hypothetical protein B4N89_34350 [Embleya scabrispora]|uniref:Acyl-CoA dehydrogenase n=1 Tax=Embleya scabrispora TaxID=159449 RepID=A0A1T3NR23_9ACTN|nr:acyl-CoA dehydrogenase family protein [Embleya scabrispora]OPC79160.1 hypothetical protein B4N89_34350 [Embleya scabrispora]
MHVSHRDGFEGFAGDEGPAGGGVFGEAEGHAGDEGFAEVAAGLVARYWGGAAAAPTGDLDRLWEMGAGHGWFDLGREDDLAASITLARVLGRAACPLPVTAGFVAARLFAEHVGLATAIGDGGIRVATALPGDPGMPGAGCLVEAGDVVGHVLHLPPGGGPMGLYRIEAVDPVEDVAAPGWTRARLGSALACLELSAADADRAVTVLRLGWAARALGAAERAAGSALAHARVRTRAGEPVGAFAAMRQRADRMELEAGDLLIADAVRRYAEGADDWAIAAELAVAQIRRVAPRVRFGAHHEPAVAGCSDEHETPWLFHRVRADLACLRAFAAPGGDAADRLLEEAPDAAAHGTGVRPSALPDPWLGPDGEAVREACRKVAARRWGATTPDSASGSEGSPDAEPEPEPEPESEREDGRFLAASVGGDGVDDPVVVAEAAGLGWFALGWSGEGSGTAAERFALRQEVCRHRLPILDALTTATVFGPAIARYGSTEQRARLLPALREGTMRIALGYRWSEADFDPAAVRASAVRTGAGERDDWILTGARIWTADAHRADRMWLVARTDADVESARAGLTVFLVPTDAPGVVLRPHRTPAGESGCIVLLDEVRVSDSARIGAVGGGWAPVAETFAAEPILLGDVAATLHRRLTDVIALLRAGAGPRPAAGARGSAARAALAELAVRTQAVRLLATAAAVPAPGGPAEHPRPHASAARVLGAELAADFGPIGLELLGPAAVLGTGAPGAPGAGGFEPELWPAPSHTPAGDTDDLRHDLHHDRPAHSFGLPARL